MIRAFIIELFATFFYVGYLPFFPGTWASLIAAGIFFLLPSISVLYMVMLTFFLGLIAIWISHKFEQTLKIPDASCIVLDEVVGMSIALVGIPKQLYLYLLAFIFFRIFDISKIPPINIIEEKVHGGWGVVGDDVIAGLMARGCVALLISCVTF